MVLDFVSLASAFFWRWSELPPCFATLHTIRVTIECNSSNTCVAAILHVQWQQCHAVVATLCGGKIAVCGQAPAPYALAAMLRMEVALQPHKGSVVVATTPCTKVTLQWRQRQLCQMAAALHMQRQCRIFNGSCNGNIV